MGKTLRIATKDATLLSPTPSNPFVSTRAPVIDLTVPAIPTHAKFTQGVYTVLADRWFGRGRVLSKEFTTEFTAPLCDILPGESADIRIEDGLLRNAQVLESTIKNASVWRINPPCKNARICPGCTLQHVSAEGRENYHQTLIREVLERFGGFLNLPAIRVHRGPEGAHRMRTRLWLRAKESEASNAEILSAWEVGMRQRGDRNAPLVDFGGCIANATALQHAAARLRSLPIPAKAWRRIDENKRWIELSQRENTLWVRAETWPDALLHAAITHLQNAPAPSLPVQHTPADAPWTPVNPPMQQALYDAIFESMDMRGKKVFDLTCADGGLTFALAERGAEVWASDRHWPAVERTRAQAEARGMTNVHTRGGNAEAVLNGAMRRNEPVDVLVINPMREPMGEQTMLSAHQSGARDLFYLAPAPKAGAKDLAILRKLGWTILRSDAFVLHPWTGQSMLFAWMRKSR